MPIQKLHRVALGAVWGLSLFALALVLGAAILLKMGRFHPTPDGDEGTPAHLFQLAILLLVPAGLAYLLSADWKRPLRVVAWLAPPIVAVGTAFVTLYVLEHPR